ncbi:unnamed protein product [Rotaria sp. Silwood1]|nr:unnamed protein product [Rotaria sp. Silwood1]CAF3431257.1 unnamed protein product [Rotaria sp. Silwood1]CAF4933069.1 unnamed protein product [Rotaria sp. Silwood1]
MATAIESNLCSICNKSSTKYFCIGFKNYFCPKDFKEHEQELSMKFDNEIVLSHDELLDQIQRLEKSNYSSWNLFERIEQWKKATINKVEQAAEQAHHKLIELIDKQRTRITEQLEPITTEIRCRREEENFLENDIDRLQNKINEIQQILELFIKKDTNKTIIVDNNQIDWNRLIHIREEQLNSPLLNNVNLSTNTKWIQNAVTVAGGNETDSALNLLSSAYGLCVDDDQTVYIADCNNHCIVEWECGATTGRVVAGGNGAGNRPDQLNGPTDVMIDKETDSFIICDYNNKRVVRWPRQNGTNGETIISNVGCIDLAMDDNGFLYVADYDKHEVRRYRMGENRGTVVAGGNGAGNRLDQLHSPRYIFIDRDHSVYVSDHNNHRVMKWMKGAPQGIVVAGGQGSGNRLTQLSAPLGVVVDQSGTIYVADYWNHRIMRWSQGATQGSVIVGGNGQGSQSNQLSYPTGLSFDREGNLYVSEFKNHRVQKFNIDRS